MKEIRKQDDKINRDYYANILKKILMDDFDYNLSKYDKPIKIPDGHWFDIDKKILFYFEHGKGDGKNTFSIKKFECEWNRAYQYLTDNKIEKIIHISIIVKHENGEIKRFLERFARIQKNLYIWQRLENKILKEELKNKIKIILIPIIDEDANQIKDEIIKKVKNAKN